MYEEIVGFLEKDIKKLTCSDIKREISSLHESLTALVSNKQELENIISDEDNYYPTEEQELSFIKNEINILTSRLDKLYSFEQEIC